MEKTKGGFHDQGDSAKWIVIRGQVWDHNPYTPCGRAHPPNGLTAVWGVAFPQGGRPAAIFFPLGYPFPVRACL
jgi:hypothetical protein